MNAQEMLDYAIGQLDGPAREKADGELVADPEQAEKFDRLVRAIHQLLDDGATIEPPPDLAGRTLAFVSENRRRRRSLLDVVPVTVPFRWADVAVAAGILLAGLLTLLPAVHRSKDRMDQASCVFNLQQLGLGLAQYGHQHHVYPYKSPDCPRATTGTFAALLHDSGFLDDLSLLDCPCNGSCQHAQFPISGALRPEVERSRPLPAADLLGLRLQRRLPRGRRPGAPAGDALPLEHPAPRRSAVSRRVHRAASCPATARITAAWVRTSSSPTCTWAGTTPDASGPTIPTCSSMT